MDRALLELVRYIAAPDEEIDQSSRFPDTLNSEKIYRLRFEAAEIRYAQMKALVCASVEKQMKLEAELKSTQFVDTMQDTPTIMWDLMTELKSAKSEVIRLSEMNRCLRSGLPMTMPPPVLPVKSNAKLQADLISAQNQIIALDMELARMNDLRFEDDERIREYEDVIDRILGHEYEVDMTAVHPRFHPMSTCSDPACKNYAKRLRKGMRQAVAEVRVRRCLV